MKLGRIWGIDDRGTRIYILFLFCIAHSVDCLYGLVKLGRIWVYKIGEQEIIFLLQFLLSGYCCRNIDFLWINVRYQQLKLFYELSCSHSLVYYTIARMSSFSSRSV